jgi:hypothetical protein
MLEIYGTERSTLQHENGNGLRTWEEHKSVVEEDRREWKDRKIRN